MIVNSTYQNDLRLSLTNGTSISSIEIWKNCSQILCYNMHRNKLIIFNMINNPLVQDGIITGSFTKLIVSLEQMYFPRTMSIYYR